MLEVTINIIFGWILLIVAYLASVVLFFWWCHSTNRKVKLLNVIAVIIIGILYFSLITYCGLEPRIEQKISLVERYPNQWPKTDGIQPDKVLPLFGRTLKAVFEKSKDDYTLAPFIENDNNEIPFIEARIIILIPVSFNVRFKQPKMWTYDQHSGYHFFHAEGFGPVLKGGRRSVNEMLYLGFPEPGVYPIKYRISGIAQGKTVNKEGSFKLELIKENTVIQSKQ